MKLGLDFEIGLAAQTSPLNRVDFIMGYLDNVLNTVDSAQHDNYRSAYAQGVNAAYHDSHQGTTN